MELIEVVEFDVSKLVDEVVGVGVCFSCTVVLDLLLASNGADNFELDSAVV